MASHVEHEMEEIQPNKQGTGEKAKNGQIQKQTSWLIYWRNIFAYGT